MILTYNFVKLYKKRTPYKIRHSLIIALSGDDKPQGPRALFIRAISTITGTLSLASSMDMATAASAATHPFRVGIHLFHIIGSQDITPGLIELDISQKERLACIEALAFV